MAASPNITSKGDAMIFTQSEATAAQRTWVFYLSNAVDGTPATGKTLATTDFKISKAGGAFGNAVGTITEISLGWYKIVFDVGDLDTIGALACELSGEAGVDTLHVTHQVTLFDLNSATVALATGGIAAATFAAGAIDAAAIATDAIGALELAAGAAGEIADAVWDEALSGHVATGSAGLAAQLAAAGNAGNMRIDTVTYDAVGMMTAARLRLFDTAAHAEASTSGGSAETGTVGTWTIAVSGANGRMSSYLASED